MATVNIGDQRFVTDDGHYAVRLARGNYSYEVATLFGAHSGDITYDGQSTLHIKIPTFRGWQPRQFDSLAVFTSVGYTVRWKRGYDIRVWIHPEFTSNLFGSVAWDALMEWQSLLKETIRFVQVGDKAKAHLTVEPKPHGFFSDPIVGECWLYWNNEGYITRGHVYIREDWTHDRPLMRHEVGHCIGLGHSENDRHIMYPVIGPDNQFITSFERDMVRLLYSVPPRTRSLHAAARAGDGLYRGELRFDPDTGLWSQVLR